LKFIKANLPTKYAVMKRCALDLFDESFGDVQETLQINFMVDINFLMKNLSTKKCTYVKMAINLVTIMY
jgi:hypothetical protein